MHQTALDAPRARRRHFLAWRPVVAMLGALIVTLAVTGILAPSPASAAVVSLAQCNGQGPGPGGATTIMNCDITVVNTINGGLRSSVVTVSRTCSLDPCTGSSSQSFTDVVTSINQCNGSDNDAAHPINCNVRVTNFVSADTPGAQPVTAATSNQCVGSFTGGGGHNNCVPYPANTTGATVTQCNGSGNGGGGTVTCTVPGSTIDPAIPIQINQCNGTGNPGGSVVTCSASIVTTVTAAVVGPTPTPTAVTTTPVSVGAGGPSPSTGPGGPGGPAGPGGTSPGTPGTVATPTTPGTVGLSGPTPTPTTPTTPGTLVGAAGPTPAATAQIAVVPTGGVQTGGGSTAGLQHTGLLVLGGTLLFGAAGSALLRRRFLRRD
jgi:hypothetical protein